MALAGLTTGPEPSSGRWDPYNCLLRLLIDSHQWDSGLSQGVGQRRWGYQSRPHRLSTLFLVPPLAAGRPRGIGLGRLLVSSPHQPGSISSRCLMRPQLRGRAKSLVNNNTRSENRLAEPCGYWPFQGSSSLEEQAATKKGESTIEWGSRSKRGTQRAPKPQKKTSKNGPRNY